MKVLSIVLGSLVCVSSAFADGEPFPGICVKTTHQEGGKVRVGVVFHRDEMIEDLGLDKSKVKTIYMSSEQTKSYTGQWWVNKTDADAIVGECGKMAGFCAKNSALTTDAFGLNGNNVTVYQLAVEGKKVETHTTKEDCQIAQYQRVMEHLDKSMFEFPSKKDSTFVDQLRDAFYNSAVSKATHY